MRPDILLVMNIGNFIHPFQGLRTSKKRRMTALSIQHSYRTYKKPVLLFISRPNGSIMDMPFHFSFHSYGVLSLARKLTPKETQCVAAVAVVLCTEFIAAVSDAGDFKSKYYDLVIECTKEFRSSTYLYSSFIPSPIRLLLILSFNIQSATSDLTQHKL